MSIQSLRASYMLKQAKMEDVSKNMKVALKYGSNLDLRARIKRRIFNNAANGNSDET